MHVQCKSQAVLAFFIFHIPPLFCSCPHPSSSPQQPYQTLPHGCPASWPRAGER